MARRSKAQAKAELPNGKPPASAVPADAAELEDLLSQEEAYRKSFEPVAPWKRDNIPDYGPLRDQQHVFIFLAVGLVCTLFYETTDYFNEINRWVAYMAIWFPLWFRLLGRVAPAPTDEELERREKQSFLQELHKITEDAETMDD